MFKHIPTGNYNWIIIIGVILFVFEVIFFYGGAIIPAIFSAIFIYIGWKKFDMLWGKILFWVSLASLVFSVLNLMAVRFLILVAVVLFIVNFTKSTRDARHEAPILPGRTANQEPLLKMELLFDHTIFDDQYTDEIAYQWRDVNIHSFMGDKIIDLSNTVLPNDTAVISIRHGLGNIEIYVPYEVEVSIHHSAIFGRTHIFNENHEKMMNKSLHYQTRDYDLATSRVKIITSVFSGDIEVRRI